MCGECSIATFCENQKAFGELIKNLSSNAIELIGDSFVLTPFTKRIMNVTWHKDMDTTFTIRKKSALVTEAECDKDIKESLS